MDGFAVVYILPFGEEYELTFPSYQAKGFLYGTLTMEIVGNVTVSCKQSNLCTEIDFKAKPMLGGEYNMMEGKIKQGKKTLYTLSGKWDSEVILKNSETDEKKIFWNPTPEVQKERAIKYRPVWDELQPNESEKLWIKVTEAIKSNDQQAATLEKTVLEDKQREYERKRAREQLRHDPKYFQEENGVWIYKKFNKSLWKPDEEIDEYERNGFIYSRKVQSDDPAEPEQNLRASPPLRGGFIDNSNQLSQGPNNLSPPPSDIKLEERLKSIEVKLIELQRNKSTPPKSSKVSKLFTALMLFALIFLLYYIYLLNQRIIRLEAKRK